MIKLLGYDVIVTFIVVFMYSVLASALNACPRPQSWPRNSGLGLFLALDSLISFNTSTSNS